MWTITLIINSVLNNLNLIIFCEYCFFFAITSRIMICNLPQAEDVDELKYKMINLQAKLDYIIEWEYERGVCRVCACRNYRKIIRNI